MSTETTEQAVEEALERAAAEPAHRPEFYKKLLAANAYLLGSSSDSSNGEYIAKEGSQISITHWKKDDGSSIIPFFSSLSELQKAIETEESYIRLPVRTFFEMTKGANLVLNPRSSYGKEFFPGEIKALLATGVNNVPNRRVVQEETRVLLGQPSSYPIEMVDALSKLFWKHQNVTAAYLALMQIAGSDEQPTLVVGIEGEGDLEEVIRQAGSVAGDSLKSGEYVDFTLVEGRDEGLDRYFRESTQPFYRSPATT
jgi:hypothetical protein